VGEVGPHPWLNKADTKFKDGGEFHATLLIDFGAPQEKFTSFIQEAAQAALEEHLRDKVPKGEHKKWKVYLPFEPVCDADGNETGQIEVKFAQNHTLKLKDGTIKKVYIAVYDRDDTLLSKEVTDPETGEKSWESPPIFAGAEVRFRYTLRPVAVQSAKMAGVRLDFSSVQIIKSGGGAKRGGFGAYSDDTEAQATTSDGEAAEDSPY
jgi:hypothetical protein